MYQEVLCLFLQDLTNLLTRGERCEIDVCRCFQLKLFLNATKSQALVWLRVGMQNMGVEVYAVACDDLE